MKQETKQPKEGLHTQGEDLQICEDAIYRAYDYLFALGKFTSPTEEGRKIENLLIQARVRISEVKNERKALLDALESLVKAYDLKMGKSALQLRIDLAKDAINNAKNI